MCCQSVWPCSRGNICAAPMAFGMKWHTDKSGLLTQQLWMRFELFLRFDQKMIFYQVDQCCGGRQTICFCAYASWRMRETKSDDGKTARENGKTERNLLTQNGKNEAHDNPWAIVSARWDMANDINSENINAPAFHIVRRMNSFWHRKRSRAGEWTVSGSGMVPALQTYRINGINFTAEWWFSYKRHSIQSYRWGPLCWRCFFVLVWFWPKCFLMSMFANKKESGHKNAHTKDRRPQNGNTSEMNARSRRIIDSAAGADWSESFSVRRANWISVTWSSTFPWMRTIFGINLHTLNA